MRNFFAVFIISLLICSCGNRGELHREWSYEAKGTPDKIIYLQGYDTLSYHFVDNSNLLLGVNYRVDSLEPIEELNFRLSEIDSFGNFIRFFLIDSIKYYRNDLGEGGQAEISIPIDSSGIIFKNATDSVLASMKLPGIENLFYLYYHKCDSLPTFLHMSLTMKTRKKGKIKNYGNEIDFEIYRTEYRGSGGMGKLFCENHSPFEKSKSIAFNNSLSSVVQPIRINKLQQ